MSNLITAIGTLLEVVLLWRLISWKAWRPYPYFFAFFVSILSRLILIEVQLALHPLDEGTYARLYWYSGAVTAALRFLVFWEVFRNSFPRHTSSQSAAAISLSTLMAFLAFAWNLAGAQEGQFFTRLIANLGFTVAACIVVVVLLTRYYRLNPGINIWGMAIGIGIFSAVETVNWSAFGLDATLFGVLGYVRALSFTVMLLIWLLAMWSYAPALHPSSGPDESTAGKPSTPSPLVRALDSLKKALGPGRH